jgi:hypothetical protein
VTCVALKGSRQVATVNKTGCRNCDDQKDVYKKQCCKSGLDAHFLSFVCCALIIKAYHRLDFLQCGLQVSNVGIGAKGRRSLGNIFLKKISVS